MASCGSRQIPRFDRPIYSFDVSGGVVRYKKNVDVISVLDPRLDNAVVFLQDDFVKFVEVYVGGCLKFDPNLPKAEANQVVNDTR